MASMEDIKALRRKLGVSLLELAAHSGLPEGYIEKLEDGQIRPLDSDLQRLEKALRGARKERRGFNDFSR